MDSDPAYSSKVSWWGACRFLPLSGVEKALECTLPATPGQVLLLSSPGLEELYRCCMLFVDDMAEPRETPEHPLKQIKVRAEVPRQDALMTMSRPRHVFSHSAPVVNEEFQS